DEGETGGAAGEAGNRQHVRLMGRAGGFLWPWRGTADAVIGQAWFPGSGDVAFGGRVSGCEQSAMETPEQDKATSTANAEQLGMLLIEHGVVSEEEVQRALSEQAETGGRLGELLVARGAPSRPSRAPR